jgi:predicted nucleic acid-binding protein
MNNKNILIDTNIILDFYLSRIPFDQPASRLLSFCKVKYNAYITISSVATIYYLLRKIGTHKKVIENLKKLMTLVSILNANNKIVMNALNSNFKDFEDALQYYSCRENTKIDYIITRNSKDFKESKIPVYSPESFLKIFQNQ